MKVRLTCERCVSTCLQVHLGIPNLANTLSIVAYVVAAILPAAQTDPFIKSLRPRALICKTCMILIHQRIDKQVYCPLVLTFHHLHEIYTHK